MTKPALTGPLRVADLNARTGHEVCLEPDAEARAALAARIGIPAIRKLRLDGRIEAEGSRDWRFAGRLGATVVQDCVVTLEPVTTRIEVDVVRRYQAGYVPPEEDEIEMPEDESLEPLGEVIDPGAILEEALVLALPLYPRKDGAEIGEAVFTEPGKRPMTDEQARPFAGLAALRDKLEDDG